MPAVAIQADGRAPARARRRSPGRWVRVRPAAPLDPDRRQRLGTPGRRSTSKRRELPLRPLADAPSAPGARRRVPAAPRTRTRPRAATGGRDPRRCQATLKTGRYVQLVIRPSFPCRLIVGGRPPRGKAVADSRTARQLALEPRPLRAVGRTVRPQPVREAWSTGAEVLERRGQTRRLPPRPASSGQHASQVPLVALYASRSLPVLLGSQCGQRRWKMSEPFAPWVRPQSPHWSL